MIVNNIQRYPPKKADPFYLGVEWKVLVETVWQRDNHRCGECNQPLQRGVRGKRQGHVDHIIPRKRGGGDDLNNLQLLCRDCHTIKTKSEKIS